MKRILLSTILFFSLCTGLVYAGYTDAPYSKVQLISENSSVAPGETVLLGFDIVLDDDWHIYWVNAGDSGTPARVQWTEPEALEASSLLFPFPHRIDYGDLTSYGHEGRVLLISEVKVPDDLKPGELFSVKADFGYLICEKICVPADTVLSVDIPVTETSGMKDLRWRDLFEEAKKHWPVQTHSINVQAYAQDNFFHIVIPREFVNGNIEFFSSDADIINYADEQQQVVRDNAVEVIVKKSDFIADDVNQINGVLVSENLWPGVNRSAIWISAPLKPMNEVVASLAVQKGTMGVLLAVCFAFIGGLILNLMPCVLPVLSLKVLGLIKHAEDKDKAWMHGWAFTAGVITTFLVLASSLMILREAGELIGWGFQFQSPGFVIFMAWLLFLLALNLFGVFEVGESLTRLNWVQHHGLSASFLSGTLVTIVATPCTAPFMGAALGFALTQPAFVALLIFAALGFGLSLPYLVLTCQPALLRFVPKPGPWMNNFKRFMGLLMLATALWFLWILDAQLGRMSLGVMVLAIGVSCIGAWFLFHGQRKRSRALKSTALGLLILGLVIGYQAPRFQMESVKAEVKSAIDWIDYSPEIIDQLRKEGKPVFIDFTAKWCLSCQVNERVALNNNDVVQAVKDKGIAMVKADWTQRDEMITQALESFGKRSIPLYVLYLPGENEPDILPEIITPPIVLDAFKSIQSK